MSVIKNFPLKNITWMKVGGTAEIFFEPESIDDLIAFLKTRDQSKKIYIIGACSNLIIDDDYIPGIFIKLSKLKKIYYDNSEIIAECGALGCSLAGFAKSVNSTGFEFMLGIPGTVGGGISMNAGCFKSSYGSLISKIECINLITGEKKIISDFNFEYRKSNIDEKFLITKGFFKTKLSDKKIIIENEKKILQEKHKNQPYGLTCGSTFKNPEGLSAWKLIDECGLRGFKLNGAFISQKHTNFIMNDGTAASKDVINLVKLIQKEVLTKKNILLEPEIKFISNN